METLPELNVPLLEAAMGRIIAEPENWNQSSYACGTTRCIAGHVAELAGAYLVEECYSQLAFDCYTVTSPMEPIGIFAQRALGLTEAEADDLFERNKSAGFVTDVDVLHLKVKALIESRSGE